MKRCLLIAVTTAAILPGCVPTTNLYQTPPLYFGSSHPVPVTDSANQLSVSASVAYPVIAELRSEYRVNKNFLLHRVFILHQAKKYTSVLAGANRSFALVSTSYPTQFILISNNF